MQTLLRWITGLFAGLIGLFIVLTALYLMMNRDFTLFSGAGLAFLIALQIGIFCFWMAGSLIARALRNQ